MSTSGSNSNSQATTDRTALGDLLREVRQRIAVASGEHAARESENLVAHVLGISRQQLHLDRSIVPTPAHVQALRDCAARRATGEPLPYVIGAAYFHSVQLRVSRAVLIPRPDTEVLVDEVLANHGAEPLLFADVCTGSGAIAAALLHNRPRWRAVVSDISHEALDVARGNLPGSACCVRADLLQGIGGPVDLLTCNPPYVTRAEYESLDPQVRQFEPRVALDGGDDGLDFYRRMAACCADVLRDGGMLYLETGASQHQQVASILSGRRWRDVGMRRDLAGHPRLTWARRPR
jgi:release factor glutamine methyltransferase